MSKDKFEFPEDLLATSVNVRNFAEKYGATRFKIIVDRSSATKEVKITLLTDATSALIKTDDPEFAFNQLKQTTGLPDQTISIEPLKWYQARFNTKTVHILEDGKCPYFIIIKD